MFDPKANKRDRVALHEAGHAVMALLVGQEVQRMTLDVPCKTGECECDVCGVTYHGPRPSMRKPTAEADWQRHFTHVVAVARAGASASGTDDGSQNDALQVQGFLFQWTLLGAPFDADKALADGVKLADATFRRPQVKALARRLAMALEVDDYLPGDATEKLFEEAGVSL